MLEFLIIGCAILLGLIFIDETFEAGAINRINIGCSRGHRREDPDIDTPCPVCIKQEMWKYRTSPEAVEKWKKEKWNE